MDLYVEKGFIEKINNDYTNKKNNPSLDIIVSILKEYGDVKMFIDCDEDDLKILESQNLLIAHKTANSVGPIPIDSTFEDYLFSDLIHEQTLIFTKEKKDWFNKLNQKGALCFCYDDYEEKIKDIVTNCHIKIDLSEEIVEDTEEKRLVNNLAPLESLRILPLNKLLINDSYLFKCEDYINNFLFPLIKSLSKNKKTKKCFLTHLNSGIEKEKKYEIIKKQYASSEIILMQNSIKEEEMDKHDRLLYTNFYIVGCGIGFNRIHVKSNSEISTSTIFEKYTYNRLKNHLKDIEKLLINYKKDSSLKLYYPN